MKNKIVLLLLATLFSFASHAQRNMQKGLFVELTAGYSNLDDEHFTVISPSIGYQFNKHWLAGMRIGFETRNHAFTIYTPYVRYNYLSMSKWELFAEAQTNIATREIEGGQGGYGEIGIGLGASYTLTRNIKVIGRYLFIGYSSRDARKQVYAGNGDFLLDANITRLQLGAQVRF
ncbi:Uncharacterised protein [Bacteroides heparinolyticus]|uniref:Outer membrane protein beta-barrel domain-containing protein n=2 Tax=Prevotella heparinolytica TaxID=28113 RepID=A0A449I0F4_9BACE|nr:outer membrane beta-barrel protein [Bacteroides heparinolyticus]VFB12896.1 Uncharacterised protein [Bacteroides heparinolyticus]